MAGKNKREKDAKILGTHVTLIKYPGRLFFSLFVSLIMTVGFAAWIWAGLRNESMNWLTIGLPLVFIGLLTNVLQPEEEWTYTPWQETPQKYEKNIYD